MAENVGYSRKNLTFALTYAVIAQLVEHQLPKLRVASSSLVYRSQKYLQAVNIIVICLLLIKNVKRWAIW